MTPALIAALLVAAGEGAVASQPEQSGPFRSCLTLPAKQAVARCREALAGEHAPARKILLLRMLGSQLASLARWEEAARVYGTWVELEPEQPEALRRYGEALLVGTEQVHEAAAVLRDSVARARGDARAHGWLGVALNILGRHAEAVRAFEDALGLDATYFSSRPAAREVFEAAQRGERWPAPAGAAGAAR